LRVSRRREFENTIKTHRTFKFDPGPCFLASDPTHHGGRRFFWRPPDME
jgi:hypothetical protein